jgi:hypothetical protein
MILAQGDWRKKRCLKVIVSGLISPAFFSARRSFNDPGTSAPVVPSTGRPNFSTAF